MAIRRQAARKGSGGEGPIRGGAGNERENLLLRLSRAAVEVAAPLGTHVSWPALRWVETHGAGCCTLEVLDVVLGCHVCWMPGSLQTPIPP